jgi:hypothetical protein
MNRKGCRGKWSWTNLKYDSDKLLRSIEETSKEEESHPFFVLTFEPGTPGIYSTVQYNDLLLVLASTIIIGFWSRLDS